MKLLFCIVKMILICISDLFCCESHVDDCSEVKLECIQYMNEVIDSILSKSVVGDVFAQISLM